MSVRLISESEFIAGLFDYDTFFGLFLARLLFENKLIDIFQNNLCAIVFVELLDIFKLVVCNAFGIALQFVIKIEDHFFEQKEFDLFKKFQFIGIV
jgi:hypothetical protein